MVKKGISGGMISVYSLIEKNERSAFVKNSMIRTSSSIREAAKIGLQSLYANADEVLEKYKDFDIIKEMKARNGSNLLWVRARAIDADVCNTNGDYFSEEELTKEVDYQGKKMPAYKTFEGVPIYTNHKNDNIEEAKGMVVYAEWDDDEKCVYCVFFIDEDAYPDIARGVRHGYIHDVSMGCFVPGTQVLTENGYKAIETVDFNDRLLDAQGNLTEIVNLQTKLETEKVYEIKLEGGYSFKCTKEHPILSVTKKDWQKRVKRNKNTVPQRTYSSVNPDFIEAQFLKTGDLLAVKTGGEIFESDLSVSKAKLLGLFAAEGNFLKYKNKIKEVEFTFSIDEKETLVKECSNLFNEVFEVDARIYERIPKNTIAVRVTSEKIANWFKYHIGEYSNKKTLSNDLRFANPEIQKAFICSWLKGDGCITHKSLKSNGISGTTCSINLAKDITYILTRLGLYHKIYAKFEKQTYTFGEALKIFTNSKGFDGRNMSFDIEIPSYEASLIAKDCDFVCNSYKYPQKNKNYSSDFIFRKIKSIQELAYNGPVYNFETESHTYTVSNIGVHNCSVDEGVCSICGNKATTERDYCDCLKKYKGKMHPSGKKAFEYNYGIKFIELSCVGDGAFESCEIMELYDQDELLQKAEKTIKAAQSLNSSISLAAAMNNDFSHKREVENALRELMNLNNKIVKVAQTAGTLVGGQLLGSGGTQNATVVKVLQGLGIDPSSSLNILDLVNLALNFLEVAVLNLFSRKDNIDLGHVAKLTKAMGELQNTLQDMIDDGIESAGQSGGQPMIPAQNQQQIPAENQTPAAPEQQGNVPAQTQSFNFEPSVGTLVSPFSQQPYVMPLGGNVSASSDNVRFVWASSIKDEEEITFLGNTPKLNKFGKFALALLNLKQACNIPEKNNEVNYIYPQKDKISASSGDKNIMDHFKKIAQDLKKENTLAYALDIKIDDKSGNRIVLSTDKGIKGFHKGQLTNWKPNLSDDQIAQMENGHGYRVAADLLKDFAHTVKTASDIDALIIMDKHIEDERQDDEVRILSEIEKEHKTEKNLTMQERLDARRNNKEVNTVMDEHIDSEREDTLVRIVSELSKDAKQSVGDKSLAELLNPDHGHSDVSGKEIMASVINSVAKTCLQTSKSPEDVLRFLTKSASKKSFAKVLKLARLGTPAREYNSVMKKFSQVGPIPAEEPLVGQEPIGGNVAAPAPMEGAPGEMPGEMPETALKNIADDTAPEVTEGEIMDAIMVIADKFAEAAEKIKEIIQKVSPEEASKKDEMADALGEDDMDTESMKGAVTGLSLSTEDTGMAPENVVDEVNSMPVGDLATGIDTARKPQQAIARSRARKVSASRHKTDLRTNIVGWLADVANQNKLSTEKVALAAKLFCSYKEAATKVLQKSTRTSEVKVVDETSHSTTIYATLDDIGINVEDAAFNQKFRDFAVDLLSKSGYEVDPTTFALTDIEVCADGMVCGKVCSRATKTFIPEIDNNRAESYYDMDRDMVNIEKNIPLMPSSPELGVGLEIAAMPEVVMSSGAKKTNKLARLKNLVRIAQGLGLPGAPGAAGGAPAMGAGGAAPMDPNIGGMAGGAADLGVGSLTGSTPDMGMEGDASIDESPEPGTKKAWGTVCPQCGSTDVDIANGEGNCNSCGANLKFKFIVEVVPPDENKEGIGEPDLSTMNSTLPLQPPTGGIGSPEAGLGAPAAPGAPAAGMPAMATNYRVMTRVAYQTTADVYAGALSETFTKDTADRLPVGMICPGCGSRTASKNSKHTYCYDCGTISVSTVKKVAGKPGVLEASIVWI